MDSENDLIFSVFDAKKGPIVYFTTLKSSELAKKAAVKSFVAIGGMEEKFDLDSKHAVLSLPESQKIAFFYMFKVRRKETDSNSKNSCWAVLGFTHDSDKSINFYRSIPIIEIEISKIAEAIRNKFVYSEKDLKLEKELIDLIIALRTPEILQRQEPTAIETLKFVDAEEGDLSFLIEYFSKDLAKIVYSLMLEEPVIIAGDIKTIMSKIVSSINIIVPHRILTSEYALNYIDPKDKDIIICSGHSAFLKKYKGFTLVDANNRKVHSRIKGVPSIEDLLKTLQISPKEIHEPIIQTYVDKLLAKVTELMELCEKEQIDLNEIRNFRSDLKADELNIVISMVKHYAPQFEEKLFYFARSLV
jgi:hypothetical protein